MKALLDFRSGGGLRTVADVQTANVGSGIAAVAAPRTALANGYCWPRVVTGRMCLKRSQVNGLLRPPASPSKFNYCQCTPMQSGEDTKVSGD